jgi:hypothetical protein
MELSISVHVSTFLGTPVADVFEGTASLEATKELIEFLGLELLNFYSDRVVTFSGSHVVVPEDEDVDDSNFDVFVSVMKDGTPEIAMALGASADELLHTEMSEDMKRRIETAPSLTFSSAIGVAAALLRAARWQRYRALQHDRRAIWARRGLGLMSLLEAEARQKASEKAAETCRKKAEELESDAELAKGLELHPLLPGECRKGERSWEVYSGYECLGSVREYLTEDPEFDGVAFSGRDSLNGRVGTFDSRWEAAIEIAASYSEEVAANTEKATRMGRLAKDVVPRNEAEAQELLARHGQFRVW